MLGKNLKYLRTKNKLSQQLLSDTFGIPRTTLGDYEREKTEPNLAMLIQMADYFDLTVDELIRKDLSHAEYEVIKTQNLKVLAISVNEENENLIELVDTKAEAGYLDSYQNPEYIRDLPKIQLPHLPAGTFRAFEIQGDSMLPIEAGNIILASYVESISDIKEGRTYIVISKREGLVYKRIKVDIENKQLILSSDNEIYLPYKLALEEVDELWAYYAHVSFSDDKKKFDTKVETQLVAIHQKVNEIHARL